MLISHMAPWSHNSQFSCPGSDTGVVVQWDWNGVAWSIEQRSVVLMQMGEGRGEELADVKMGSVGLPLSTVVRITFHFL